MRGLIGDRFLRIFSGHLKFRQKHADFYGEGQNPEAVIDAVIRPEAVTPVVHTSEEDREEAVADSADADAAVVIANDVPIQAEPNKQNELKPKAE